MEKGNRQILKMGNGIGFRGEIIMEKVAIIGAGVMGSALAIHLGNNDVRVNLWGTQWDTKALDNMKENKRHDGFDIALPDNVDLYYSDQLKEAVEDTSLVIVAVLSSGMEAMIKDMAPYLRGDHYILSITKGIDGEKLRTMSEVIEGSLPDGLRDRISIIKLGGPIIAKELASGRYVEGVLASKDIKAAEYARTLFRSPQFKVDVSRDIMGVDLCAAFKNVYAIGVGIAESLDEGSNNMKAALMARGTIEMGRIVAAYGGDENTASGIAGVGDYYVTSQGGRNGMFGKHLGQGKSVEKALEDMNGLAVEGYAAASNGYNLLKDLGERGKIDIEEDVPLFQELYNVLYNEKAADEAIDSYWISE